MRFRVVMTLLPVDDVVEFVFGAFNRDQRADEVFRLFSLKSTPHVV